MKTWKTVLIEDEQPARERLTRLLLPYTELRIVGEADNGIEGLTMIKNLQPDLVFLDIEMPGFNGFELLSQLTNQPKVIFTTAYDQYALKAFEENSVDYLLKPIEKDRLEKSMHKLRQSAPPDISTNSMETLIRQLAAKKGLKTLTVKSGDRILLIKLHEIIHLEADDKYVFLHMLDGSRHLMDATMSGLAEQLPEQFLRIHRSLILNTDHIQEIRRGFTSTLVFQMNGPQQQKLISSRANYQMLKDRFGL